jgi:hypothetical protein
MKAPVTLRVITEGTSINIMELQNRQGRVEGMCYEGTDQKTRRLYMLSCLSYCAGFFSALIVLLVSRKNAVLLYHAYSP